MRLEAFAFDTLCPNVLRLQLPMFKLAPSLSYSRTPSLTVASAMAILAIAGTCYGVGHPNPTLDYSTPVSVRPSVAELLFYDPKAAEYGFDTISTELGELVPEAATGVLIAAQEEQLNQRLLLTAAHNDPTTVNALGLYARFPGDTNTDFFGGLFIKYPDTVTDLGLLLTEQRVPVSPEVVSSHLPEEGELLKLVGFGNLLPRLQPRPKSLPREGTVRALGPYPNASHAYLWEPAPYFGEPGDSGGPLFSDQHGLVGIFSQGVVNIHPLELQDQAFVPVANQRGWITGMFILPYHATVGPEPEQAFWQGMDVAENVLDINDPTFHGNILFDKPVHNPQLSPDDNIQDVIGILNNETLRYTFEPDTICSLNTSCVYHNRLPIFDHLLDRSDREHIPRIALSETASGIVQHADGEERLTTIVGEVPVFQRATQAGIYNGKTGTFELSGVAVLTPKFENVGTLKVVSRQLLSYVHPSGVLEVRDEKLLPLNFTGETRPGLGFEWIQSSDFAFIDFGIPAAVNPSVLKIGSIDKLDLKFSPEGHTGLFVNRGTVEIDELSTIWVDGDFVHAGGVLKAGKPPGLGPSAPEIRTPNDVTKGRFVLGVLGGEEKAKVILGHSIGALHIDSHTLVNRGELDIEVSQFDSDFSTPGWDTVRFRSLKFSQGSELSINVSTLESPFGESGAATGFDKFRTYSLPVILTDEGISNFCAVSKAIDTSGIVNDVSGGRFSLNHIGNDIHLVYTPISPDGLEIHSGGMSTPETISLAPIEFGAHAGSLLVPDAGGPQGPQRLWVVPRDGGTPNVFVDTDALFADSVFPDGGSFRFGLNGGTFLPEDFGDRGGKFVTAVETSEFDFANNLQQEHRRVITIDGAGNVEDFVRFDFVGTASDSPPADFPGSFSTVLIAPDDFGNLSGDLIYAHRGGAIAVSPDGNVTPFFDKFSQYPFGSEFGIVFGAVFAPDGFGEFADTLLLSDESPNLTTNHINEDALILSVDSLGVAEIFASIPLTQQQIDARVGLRQMAIVPEGYGDLSGLLLVSIDSADGVLGQVLALNSNGQVVRELELLPGLTEFDPRGFYFTGDGRILISDASDPILLARPNDFVVVPEPATLMMFTLVSWLGLFRIKAFAHS